MAPAQSLSGKSPGQGTGPTEEGTRALTVGLYSAKPDVIDAMTAATQRAGVALSINLLSNVYVNQSASFSDYHATGANPAANSSYTDSAFVANRFRVIQRRWHA